MCKYVLTRVQAALNNTATQEAVKERMLQVWEGGIGARPWA